MWVSDGQTQVDTSELISAAVQMSDALAAARRAAMVLWEVGHQVGPGGAWPDGSMGAVTTPLGVELEEQVAVAQVQLVQVRQDLQQFTILSDRHAEWLSQQPWSTPVLRRALKVTLQFLCLSDFFRV